MKYVLLIWPIWNYKAKKIKELGTYYALSIWFLDTHMLFR